MLIRNVLQVPSSPDCEKRGDNDASLHDQVLWGLHESGIFDLILFILSSEYESQYHLHALEIVSLIYREQVMRFSSVNCFVTKDLFFRKLRFWQMHCSKDRLQKSRKTSNS